jgi:drug/metabolite transporter (DMT)-like permease
VITIGNILTSIAYQRGRAFTIGTLSFSYIPFVGLWGFLLLGELPEITTVVGMALIISAGYAILRA